jgi:hypothetical protein
MVKGFAFTEYSGKIVIGKGSRGCRVKIVV